MALKVCGNQVIRTGPVCAQTEQTRKDTPPVLPSLSEKPNMNFCVISRYAVIKLRLHQSFELYDVADRKEVLRVFPNPNRFYFLLCLLRFYTVTGAEVRPTSLRSRFYIRSNPEPFGSKVTQPSRY